jgi:hypothetical protein
MIYRFFKSPIADKMRMPQDFGNFNLLFGNSYVSKSIIFKIVNFRALKARKNWPNNIKVFFTKIKPSRLRASKRKILLFLFLLLFLLFLRFLFFIVKITADFIRSSSNDGRTQDYRSEGTRHCRTLYPRKRRTKKSCALEPRKNASSHRAS